MKSLAIPLVALALLAQPVAAQGRCVTDAQAESLALVALPEIIRETGRVCSARLPAASLIRRADSDLIARYQAAADRAWPAAKTAIGQLSDPAVVMLLDSEYARPVIASVVVPQIVGRIDLADCGTIDRLVTQLEPLPPRNTASVVVTVLRYLKTDRARAGKAAVPQLPLCPAP
ncbi:hypothetical protein Q5H91_03000 [Sphingomonas sp. KR1UV-12]|uniref:YpeB-like protein with protease inhibitory function n=1 Tax=Sphingomonas aurea TaxID=3063994 RepID=A0ABT9EHR7_9SPHN|nr:hypothetical protein [Sphingomonas sp. KR1UV-12]MDP1026168.1 hypothetical protein [Sphingomonas sp. KR1UV-12]